jgi:hypothetical protein
VAAVTITLFLDEPTRDSAVVDDGAYRKLDPVPKIDAPHIFDFQKKTEETTLLIVSDEMRSV